MATSIRRFFALVGFVPVMAACTTSDLSVSGFRPVSPKNEIMLHSLSAPGPTVESLQPLLVWEPFPGVHEEDSHITARNSQNDKSAAQAEPTSVIPGKNVRAFVQEDPANISDVRYELRIWEAAGSWRAGKVVYERANIAQPKHRVDTPLKPNTRYFWSTRARYKLSGAERLTEWSLINSIIGPPNSSTLKCGFSSDPECTPRAISRRDGYIRANFLFRFKTPSA